MLRIFPNAQILIHDVWACGHKLSIKQMFAKAVGGSMLTFQIVNSSPAGMKVKIRFHLNAVCI